MNKKTFLFLSLFIVIFLGISASTALALEVSLPGICDNPADCNPTLLVYIKYFFNIAVGAAAILALISFTIGAVGLINPSTEGHTEAKERMKDAILGLVLTLTSFIIMQTINPQLSGLNQTTLPALAGVFYTNDDGTTTKPAPLEENDMDNRPKDIMSGNFNKIFYKCSSKVAGEDPILRIWQFRLPGLENGNADLSGVKVTRVTCGDAPTDLSGYKSFEMAYETPGIYYYLGADCKGFSSGATPTPENYIGNPFTGNIASVMIVNGKNADGPFYGVIFHKESGLSNGGKCNEPIINSNPGFACLPVPDKTATSAADIFVLNKQNSSGSGVTLYSSPFTDLSGTTSLYTNITDAMIRGHLPSYSVWPTAAFTTNPPGVKDSVKTKCANFIACPGSIKIRGLYLVAIYSPSLYCQTFVADVPNLNAQPILGNPSDVMREVKIIPTK